MSHDYATSLELSVRSIGPLMGRVGAFPLMGPEWGIERRKGHMRPLRCEAVGSSVDTEALCPRPRMMQGKGEKEGAEWGKEPDARAGPLFNRRC